jgi:uridine kinase
MVIFDKTFKDESEKLNFIMEAEERFESELDRVARAIRDEEGLKVVTLSGPSCSGKTTTAATLIRDWGRDGQRVRLISIDDFFRDRDDLYAEAKAEGLDEPDFETVRAIDFELLQECVENISHDGIVRQPVFEFTLGRRTGFDEFCAADYDVVLFEGIQAIYPEVTALFKHYRHKSIFVSVADDITIGGIYFSRRKVRFLRRLVRDYTYRAASPEYTFQLWRNVARNEDKNILPYEDNADVKFNSLLPYELFVIKPFALPLLYALPKDSEFRYEADGIIEKLEKLETIDSAYVPDLSVFREFIGPKEPGI